MNNFGIFLQRSEQALLGLSSLIMLFCLSIPAKVAHSMPLSDDFNISLKNVDPVPGAANYQVKTVVLDAGHGGKDPGCLGKKTTEKEVALDVVLRLGQMIKENYPDVKVIYTRSTDEFIPLYKRAEIANKSKADLFISVHANAAHKRSVYGSETFVLGLHRAADNLEVAKRENAAILKEENHAQHYDGFDPNSDEGHIALSMYQNAYLDQSITLANLIETEFVSHAERSSRGVKQAGFIVLHKTYMPSVLVEVGFLSNGKEENFLISEDGKRRSATSIFNAFSKYKYDIESYGAQMAANGAKEQATKPIAETVAASVPAKQTEAKVESQVRRSTPSAADKKVVAAVTQQPKKSVSSPAMNKSNVDSKTSSKSKSDVVAKVNDKSNVSSSTDKIITPARGTSKVSRGPVKYVVQVAAGSKKLAPSGQKWNTLEDVLIRYEGNMYKYQIGEMDTYQEAIQRKSHLREKGFADCFIVAYRDGKQVKLGQAVAMTSQ